MFDSFPGGTPERLDRPTYHADLGRVYGSGIGFLNKLDHGQHFQERGSPIWEPSPPVTGCGRCRWPTSGARSMRENSAGRRAQASGTVGSGWWLDPLGPPQVSGAAGSSPGTL
jgi:hypothetical protein